jgi:hypothetical protein
MTTKPERHSLITYTETAPLGYEGHLTLDERIFFRATGRLEGIRQMGGSYELEQYRAEVDGLVAALKVAHDRGVADVRARIAAREKTVLVGPSVLPGQGHPLPAVPTKVETLHMPGRPMPIFAAAEAAERDHLWFAAERHFLATDHEGELDRRANEVAEATFEREACIVI